MTCPHCGASKLTEQTPVRSAGGVVPANDFPERLRALRDAKDAGLGTEGFLLDQPDRDLLTEAAEAIEEAQPRYLRAAASFQQERDEARQQRDGAEEQWRRWVEIAEAAEAERDRLRGALREILRYLDSTGQCGDHHITLGEACGMDACVLCLAESVARAALSPAEQPPSNPGAPDATGSPHYPEYAGDSSPDTHEPDRHIGPSLTDSSDPVPSPSVCPSGGDSPDA